MIAETQNNTKTNRDTILDDAQRALDWLREHPEAHVSTVIICSFSQGHTTDRESVEAMGAPDHVRREYGPYIACEKRFGRDVHYNVQVKGDVPDPPAPKIPAWLERLQAGGDA